MGIKAGDFKNLREVQMASPEQLREVLNQNAYNYSTMIVRAKVDDYQGNNGGDEVRFRY
jgi:hypothetical protein